MGMMNKYVWYDEQTDEQKQDFKKIHREELNLRHV
jgi:hypothetical protein